jgi:hypothetical protein
MSRNQTLVIDVKIFHKKEMSFEEFLKFCQNETGLDVAAATKRWDRIFKQYDDGMFEVDDLSAEEVDESVLNQCEELADERVKCLVEEFDDESEEAKKRGMAMAAERIAKMTTHYPRDAEEFLPADEDCEDFFAGKSIPVKRGNLEFEA